MRAAALGPFLSVAVLSCIAPNDGGVDQGAGDGDKTAQAQAQQGAFNLAYASAGVGFSACFLLVCMMLRDYFSDRQMLEAMKEIIREMKITDQLCDPIPPHVIEARLAGGG